MCCRSTPLSRYFSPWRLKDTCCRSGSGSCAAPYGGSSARSFVTTLPVAGAISIAQGPVLAAWPFLAAAVICGLLAWRLYKDEGAERALVCAVTASVLTAVAAGGFIIPALSPLFPRPALARVFHGAGCAPPVAAA